ncbi:unnamed protein product [Oikopleura dioica]|uniref:SET domain-containing protein n=1 Tax=Oikopleura dioica TaxID=34765 RepID=E4Y4D0_OIKDI|nr:unnamed protein product [Oikopleura dioica]CBY37421.1 unnamed protein product [Oikopleura dioica]
MEVEKDKAISHLRSFIEENGFVDPRIQVCKTAFDLGIIASASIKEDEVLIRIPRSCQINLHSFDSSQTSISKFIRQKNIKLTCHQILALYLALERRNPLSPAMKKFIPTLPSSCCLPLNYSPKAMANLPCEVYLLSVALQKNVTELCFALGKQIGLTKEDLTWAFSMVLSRTFSLPKYDKSSDFDYCSQVDSSKSAFLCPFMDLINHSSAPNCYYETDSETGDFVLRADRELQQKEELFITYGGSKSDHVLLAFYGFCLPPGVNRNSYIVFSPNFIGPSSHSKFTAFKFFLNSKKAKCFKESLNKKLESWRKFETAKGFVYALYEEKLCDGFQNTISVLSFLLQKV